ncbi:MAG: MarR family transcriptional regulator [Clostridia bacterium]|nr:MarR family transcriptional regulator [Clostridia bacterium]
MPSLNRSLNVIGRCGTLFRARRLEGTGVDPFNYFYLFRICREPGLSQDELSRALYVNKSSVTRHLSRLEEAGLLTRTPDPKDRRALLVHPTQKAMELLPLLREVGNDWQAALTDGFSPEETAQFESLLARAMENARKSADREEKS